MIQRKQSIYWGCIALICFFSIFWNFTYHQVTGNIDAKGGVDEILASVGFAKTEIIGKLETKYPSYQNNWLKYNYIVIILIALICIFLYNKRRIQILLSKINFVFILLSMFWMYWYALEVRYIDLAPEHQIIIAVIFPLLLLFLNFKAMSGVKADENLLKSVDRIR